VEAFKADVVNTLTIKNSSNTPSPASVDLDILVANAGVWNFDDLPIEKMSEKQWDDMIRINLKAYTPSSTSPCRT